MSEIPVGYVIGVVFVAGATAVGLWPRRLHSARATPGFVLATVSSELPLAFFTLLAASTALAFADNDIVSPAGWAAVALAGLTAIGLAAIAATAARTPAVFDAALRATFGTNYRRERTSRTLPVRVVLAPLRLPYRDVERIRNISYGPAGRANLLDVYRRRSHQGLGPTLVYFHGGGFYRGAKSRESLPLLEHFARRGWVCVSANYRLAPALFPDHLIDAKRVIAWLRTHGHEYGADAGTLVLTGGSAGANLAIICAVTPERPEFQPGFEHVDTSVTGVVGLYGYYGPAPTSGPPSAPTDYLRPDMPTAMIVHGARDPMVPAAHARSFADRLRIASANPVVYAELPGGLHTFDRFFSVRNAAVVVGVESFTQLLTAARR